MKDTIIEIKKLVGNSPEGLLKSVILTQNSNAASKLLRAWKEESSLTTCIIPQIFTFDSLSNYSSLVSMTKTEKRILNAKIFLFFMNRLKDEFKDISVNDLIFLTSESITALNTLEKYGGSVKSPPFKINQDNYLTIKLWNIIEEAQEKFYTDISSTWKNLWKFLNSLPNLSNFPIFFIDSFPSLHFPALDKLRDFIKSRGKVFSPQRNILPNSFSFQEFEQITDEAIMSAKLATNFSSRTAIISDNQDLMIRIASELNLLEANYKNLSNSASIDNKSSLFNIKKIASLYPNVSKNFWKICKPLLAILSEEESVVAHSIPEEEILLLNTSNALCFDIENFDKIILPSMNEKSCLKIPNFNFLFSIPTDFFPSLEWEILQNIMHGSEGILSRTIENDKIKHRFIDFLKPPFSPILKRGNIASVVNKVKEVSIHVSLDDRPTSFFVSDLDLLRNDPYAFYAKKILKLYPEIPSNANLEFGKWAHNLLEDYIKKHSLKFSESLQNFAQNEVKKILDINSQKQKRYFLQLLNPFLQTLEEEFQKNKEEYQSIKVEHLLSMDLEISDIKYTVKAIADRIDLFKNGSINIVDYKTSRVITESKFFNTEYMQLPLEALLYKKQGSIGFTSSTIAETQFPDLIMRLLRLKKNAFDKNEIDIIFSDEIEKNIKDTLYGLLEEYSQDCFEFKTSVLDKKRSTRYEHLSRLMV